MVTEVNKTIWNIIQMYIYLYAGLWACSCVHVRRTSYFVRHTAYIVRRTLHGVQYTAYSIHCTAYIIHYTAYIECCTMHILSFGVYSGMPACYVYARDYNVV